MGSKGRSEELIQDGSIKTFDKAVALRSFDPRGTMLNIIQGQIEFIGMCFFAAVLPSVIG